MSEEELEVLCAQLDDVLAKGWIRPCSSPYGAPVLFVRKKNKDLRLCIDYHKLNAQTVKNAGPLPCIDDLLERLGGTKNFSKLDLKSGYHQISILSNDRYKSAFKTRYGHFEWVVMPFGLTNTPTTFQAAMTDEFHAMLDQFVLVYLDDILVYSQTLEDHLGHLRRVLETLCRAKYKANHDKCEFVRQELEYLGHFITPEGISPLSDKIQATQEWPEPRNVTDVRSFLGLAGYYQRFIKGYSKISAHLTKLRCEDRPFDFEKEAWESLLALKATLLSAEVLRIYDPLLPTCVTTDASGYGIGAVLEQHDGVDWHPEAAELEAATDTSRREYLLEQLNKVLTDDRCSQVNKNLAEWALLEHKATNSYFTNWDDRIGRLERRVDDLAPQQSKILKAIQDLTAQLSTAKLIAPQSPASPLKLKPSPSPPSTPPSSCHSSLSPPPSQKATAKPTYASVAAGDQRGPKIPAPNKFRGDDPKTDVGDWAAGTKAYLRGFVCAEQTKVATILGLLEGPALKWATSTSSSQQQSMEDWVFGLGVDKLLQALEDHFVDKERARKAAGKIARLGQQRYSGTLQSLFAEFEQLTSTPGLVMSTYDLLTNFCRAAPEKFDVALYNAGHKDWRSFGRAVPDMEANLHVQAPSSNRRKGAFPRGGRKGKASFAHAGSASASDSDSQSDTPSAGTGSAAETDVAAALTQAVLGVLQQQKRFSPTTASASAKAKDQGRRPSSSQRPNLPRDEPFGLPNRPTKHHIELLPGAVPPKGRVYRMSLAELEELRKQLETLTSKGWIRPNTSEFDAPVLFVPKGNGEFRMCIDYRGLNKITRKSTKPLPRIDDILDMVQGCTVFNKVDLKSGYHQIEMAEEDVYTTAFKTSRYVTASIRLTEKSSFGVPSVIYLDHVISGDGLAPEAAKIAAIQEWPQPQTVRDVKSFMGLASYYRKFDRNNSAVAAPLTNLTKKDTPFLWSLPCQLAFTRLKKALTRAPVLKLSNPTLPFILTTDASQYGIGAVLQQDDGNGLRHVEFMSKKIKTQKLQDSTYEKELYALVCALKHWKHFLLGRHFKIFSDHSTLQWMKSQGELNDKLARYIQFIDMFDFELKHKKGCYNKVADALSRRPDSFALISSAHSFGEETCQTIARLLPQDPTFGPIVRNLQADPNVEPGYALSSDLLYTYN
ncbi:hypothetical protein CBR_g37789 [Chara braunii]|uniref:Reverse transcriptase domain-containing protein n=1 Tax=Chara braunii TaxID=69332 RepID=A0A388LNM3_CHABU|nr:hypothetical protein CBR_g37789 [Chara braunii]|eukprot:GBG83918.1 hypothetical protein CBR_g37789 [Chara braunii]